MSVTEENNDNIETVSSSSVEGGKFTRRELRNKNRPQSEQSPLTVIEFSLTKNSHNLLKDALEPYVEGDKKDEKMDPATLKSVVESALPKEALDYFRNLDSQNLENIAPNVYLIHNLPEVKQAKGLDPSIAKNNYAALIGTGISLALHKKHEPFALLRGGIIHGGLPHKHNQEISGLSGLHITPGTNTPTRFINMVGAFDDAVRAPDVKEEMIPDDLLNNGAQSIDKRRLNDHGVTKDILANRSLDITVNHGSIVLWSERGKVFHQALPTQTHGKKSNDGETIRYMLAHKISEPEHSR